jgi:hypothetical protein
MTILSQLESHLWEAANILRGPVDAADFKTYVFPLLFFKRLSDVHDIVAGISTLHHHCWAKWCGQDDVCSGVLAA